MRMSLGHVLEYNIQVLHQVVGFYSRLLNAAMFLFLFLFLFRIPSLFLNAGISLSS
ncbi:hypothetical protein D1605_004735 [Xylella fastidiosa subsp. fastidiosa]|uniref:Uncharacterized protein n=2 Tax=Xylella fastidiosa TaxID=2371 RepID=B2I4S0_XYLF2|nr:hypothetical protein [Xylella fastidiosa]ACB92365.1 hypothetical protein XfasM23_0933 [Xylella fastidiosa M23]MBE0270665.1 hypothetical protein [Xylella fastidiosa subsp. fastidiosa]MBE0272979.1 hypothetical protein [Xylella fastidiosa subsp. fastidiosa]MBE0280417.1 hypothetical protein [Xylella fastidiosa subsp. fastidiosa]MBE0283722.1 hypothetical protein [Xylella fastidiosa subsp. fastidiosa]